MAAACSSSNPPSSTPRSGQQRAGLALGTAAQGQPHTNATLAPRTQPMGSLCGTVSGARTCRPLTLAGGGPTARRLHGSSTRSPLQLCSCGGQEQREALTSVHHSAAGGHSMMAVCSTSYLCKPSQFSDIFKVKMKISSHAPLTHVPCDAVLSADHRSPGCLGCLCLPVTRPVILTWSLGYILNVIIFHQIHLGIILSYLN